MNMETWCGNSGQFEAKYHEERRLWCKQAPSGKHTEASSSRLNLYGSDDLAVERDGNKTATKEFSSCLIDLKDEDSSFYMPVWQGHYGKWTHDPMSGFDSLEEDELEQGVEGYGTNVEKVSRVP